MATYGRYDIVVYPSGYLVTDMQTHEAVGNMTANRGTAHRRARRLQLKEEAEKRAAKLAAKKQAGASG